MNKNTSHILVVDDDNRIRELIKQYLVEKKFLVSTAQDVNEARKKIALLKFDILILDIMMPGENGLILTKEIKKNSKTPIILLTARGKVEERIEISILGSKELNNAVQSYESYFMDEVLGVRLDIGNINSLMFNDSVKIDGDETTIGISPTNY